MLNSIGAAGPKHSLLVPAGQEGGHPSQHYPAHSQAAERFWVPGSEFCQLREQEVLFFSLALNANFLCYGYAFYRHYTRPMGWKPNLPAPFTHIHWKRGKKNVWLPTAPNMLRAGVSWATANRSLNMEKDQNPPLALSGKVSRMTEPHVGHGTHWITPSTYLRGSSKQSNPSLPRPTSFLQGEIIMSSRFTTFLAPFSLSALLCTSSLNQWASCAPGCLHIRAVYWCSRGPLKQLARLVSQTAHPCTCPSHPQLPLGDSL